MPFAPRSSLHAVARSIFLLLTFRRSSKHLTGRVCFHAKIAPSIGDGVGANTSSLQGTSRSHFFPIDPSCPTCEQAGFFRRYVCLLDHDCCRSFICVISRSSSALTLLAISPSRFTSRLCSPASVLRTFRQCASSTQQEVSIPLPAGNVPTHASVKRNRCRIVVHTNFLTTHDLL